MNIILDSNAFYALYGEEKLGLSRSEKVKPEFKQVLSTHSVFISGATFCECLIRIKHTCFSKIWDVLEFIVFNNIQVFPNDYFPVITNYEISLLTKMTSIELRRKIDSYESQKIIIESTFAMHYMMMLLLLYSVAYFHHKKIFFIEDNIEQEKYARESIIAYILTKYIPHIANPVKNQLQETLTKGYKEKYQKVENVFGKEFNSIMEYRISEWTSFLELIQVEDFSDKSIQSLEQRFYESKNVKKIEKYSDHIARYISLLDKTENNNPSEFIKSVYKTLLNDRKVKQIQIDYMLRLLGKLGEGNPRKFRKNDILDLIILTCLDQPENVLISFDEDVQDFLIEKKHNSIKIIENYYSRTWII